MNNAKQIPSLARICYRQLSQAGEKPSARFANLKSVQQKFQVEDGTPVYIKTGAVDKILYGTTTLLTVIGLALSTETFCKIAFGKTN